ncbi:hypothetical protein DR999_PMT01106 [Platysternon megacephalum]|uniref:Uncharacterized protein n=1 Tax=Platysternon megacephalum TaxID=55544 RepID=A0A4D9F4P9_9SAUR|nr:hypothetical protein DR999_PMT01106 [Platysternon megacephalum]
MIKPKFVTCHLTSSSFYLISHHTLQKGCRKMLAESSSLSSIGSRLATLNCPGRIRTTQRLPRGEKLDQTGVILRSQIKVSVGYLGEWKEPAPGQHVRMLLGSMCQ